MLALGVRRIGEALGRQVRPEDDVAAGAFAPFFHRIPRKARARSGHVFVDAPEKAVVLDQQIMRRTRGKGIDLPAMPLGQAIGTDRDAQVANDHVMRGHIDAAAQDRDPRGRGRLTRDRDMRLGNGQRGPFEVDRAAHFEDDDTRPFAGERFAEAARTVLGERGHANDFPARAAIGGIGSLYDRGGCNQKQAERQQAICEISHGNFLSLNCNLDTEGQMDQEELTPVTKRAGLREIGVSDGGCGRLPQIFSSKKTPVPIERRMR